MCGVDAAVGWVDVDPNADVGVGPVHDVCPVTRACHECAG